MNALVKNGFNKCTYTFLIVAACAVINPGQESSAVVGKTGGVSGTKSIIGPKRNSFSGLPSVSAASSFAVRRSASAPNLSNGDGGTSSASGFSKPSHKYGVTASNFFGMDEKNVKPNKQYVQFTDSQGRLVTYEKNLAAQVKLLFTQDEVGVDKYFNPTTGKTETVVYKSSPRWVKGSDIINSQKGSGTSGGNNGGGDTSSISSSTLTTGQQNLGQIGTIGQTGTDQKGTTGQTGTTTQTGTTPQSGARVSYTTILSLKLSEDGRVTDQKVTTQKNIISAGATGTTGATGATGTGVSTGVTGILGGATGTTGTGTTAGATGISGVRTSTTGATGGATGTSTGVTRSGSDLSYFQKDVKISSELANSQGKQGFVSTAVNMIKLIGDENSKPVVSNRTGEVKVDFQSSASGVGVVSTTVTGRKVLADPGSVSDLQ